MSDPGKLSAARYAVERLAVECLTFAYCQEALRAGGTGDQSKVSMVSVAALAAEVAVGIRLAVGQRLPEIMASDDSDEVIESMARQMMRERKA